MEDLDLNINTAVRAVWDSRWTHTDVPVFWTGDQRLPDPDPLSGGRYGTGTAHFFRNEVDFGAEELLSVGGGLGRNLRAQRGSVVIRSFSSLIVPDEQEALRLMGAARGLFRSYRASDEFGGDLSFSEPGSYFDQQPTEDGNWFMRGCIVVFTYRFIG